MRAASKHRPDPGSPFAGAALPVRQHRFPAVRRKRVKARTRLALAVMAGAALLQGCELALIGAGAGAAYSTIEDRRSSGTQLDDDAIELRAGSRIGTRFPDTIQVKARYLRANAFNPVHVKVVTEAGVVYLMGVLTEREADDAVDLARTTSGVRKVVKIFEYCKATDQVCRPRPSPPAEKPKPAA